MGYIWDFDVVYLDYFGKFLPYDRGSQSAQNRARALRHLFASDREDAWQRWLLIIAVESRTFGNRDRTQMREFLAAEMDGDGDDLAQVLNYLLQNGLPRPIEAARLVHGTLAYIISTAAANVDVAVQPRPTVIYAGSKDMPMLHFAYDIVPTGLLTGHQNPIPLLRAPFVTVTNPAQWPWFALSPEQPPGQTEAEVRTSLDFLEARQVDRILAQ